MTKRWVMNYVERDEIGSLTPNERLIHALIVSGTEILNRSLGRAKELGFDPAFIAELTAATALATASRAMLICVSQARRKQEDSSRALDLHKRPSRLPKRIPAEAAVNADLPWEISPEILPERL